MPARIESFLYGVCYYPEAWNPSRHATDIARIADAGFNYVRMGEGAWSVWEPAEGSYRFDLFDRVIDLCRSHGIKVILGTPTYAAPAWVVRNYPQVLRWNFQRVPLQHGSRRNLNYTAAKYLELSDRICTALASHYAGEKQIIGWQLDNEFNCHSDTSYAPSDTLAFRTWCKNRYGTIEALNDAWGTRFWSQTYDDWSQIDLPHPTAAPPNPSQLLDESRFISETVCAFARRQAVILRKHNSEWFITHNGLFGNVDGPALAAELDFFSHDQYPLFFDSWAGACVNLALARSLSFPFGVLEQQSGPGGQLSYLQRTPRPGELRLWTWQSVVHGANMLSYFRWRTCPYGAEQHWHGLIDADERPTARLEEARRTGVELKALPREFFAAAPRRCIGVLRDYDNQINDERIDTFNAPARGAARQWLIASARRHLPADFTWPGSDWAGYRVLIAPHLQLIDEGLVGRMGEFVRRGGTLILGAMSGLKDRNNHIVERAAPGVLAELAGVEVEQWSTVSPDAKYIATFGDRRLPFIGFVETLRPTRGESIATWHTSDSLLSGRCAATRNKIERGSVVYLGGILPELGLDVLLDWIGEELSLSNPLGELSESVEAVFRDGAETTYTCLLNHSGTEQTVANVRGQNCLDRGRAIAGELTLAPFEIAVIETPREKSR